jgi:dehydrogenase/reductase SDR family protein 13
MSSTTEGAQTPLHCATSPAVAGESGGYYVDCHRKEPSAIATPGLAAELWEASAAWADER